MEATKLSLLSPFYKVQIKECRIKSERVTEVNKLFAQIFV